MDSDDEIFLTQNTFSQEPFSPELNLEELVGDFRKQCIRPHSRQKYKSTDEGMIPINIVLKIINSSLRKYKGN